MHSPVEDQEAAFRWQLELSAASGKPIVVHIRDAWARGLQIMAEVPEASIILHCFSGDAQIATECASRGYFISFAGPVTYPKNEHLRQAAATVPLGSLLAETDSPYLSPQSSRGKENHPANVAAVVEAFASVRDETLELIARSVAQNAARAFPGLR
jgi:TatD DNase family protein